METRPTKQPESAGYIAPKCESIALEVVDIICSSTQIERLTIEETDPFNWE